MGLPIFVTGEPKKQWNFSWQILPPTIAQTLTILSKNNDLSVKDLLLKLGEFFLSIATSIYVSQLAKKVDLPDMVAETEKRRLSSVEFPFVTSFPLEFIKVEYMEDMLNTVYLYHKKWQDLSRVGMDFLPILSCCQQGVYIPTAMIPTGPFLLTGSLSGTSPVGAAVGGAVGGVNSAFKKLGLGPIPIATELPMGIETFPQIYPVRISRTSPDKSASILSTTTVTYIRVPKIEINPLAALRGFPQILGF